MPAEGIWKLGFSAHLFSYKLEHLCNFCVRLMCSVLVASVLVQAYGESKTWFVVLMYRLSSIKYVFLSNFQVSRSIEPGSQKALACIGKEYLSVRWIKGQEEGSEETVYSLCFFQCFSCLYQQSKVELGSLI